MLLYAIVISQDLILNQFGLYYQLIKAFNIK